MIIKIIVFGCVIFTVHAQNDEPLPSKESDAGLPNSKQCLTGYMTDVQSWVNANGTLTSSVEKNNAVDLSYNSDALSLLLHRILMIENKNYSVKILSLARCGLQEIPQIFVWSDKNYIFLSETIEYVSFYGNKFDLLESTGQRYDVMMNATRSTEITPVSMQRVSKSWSNGFMGIHFKKLKELDLRACAISGLEDCNFIGMPNLESLYLGENSILYIEAHAFVGLGKMVHLDLSRNFAHDEATVLNVLFIESMDIFGELQNLRSLDLSFTTLTQGNIAVFDSLSPKMQRLSLCYSNLGRLRKAAFGKTTLKYLDVSGNVEILFEPEALHGLEETLEVLYAKEIALNTIEPFKNFHKLEILKLTTNEINELPNNIVQTLSNLQILDLDRNRITAWFDKNIHYMPNLKFLTLRNNNINIITDDMVLDIANISYVGFTNNFMICSCYARELYEIGRRNEMILTNQLITKISNDTINTRFSFHTGFQDYNNLIEQRTPVPRACDYNKCDTDLELKFNGNLLFFDYNPKKYECLIVTARKSIGFQNYPTCSEEFNDERIDLIKQPANKLLFMIIPMTLLPILVLLFVFGRNLKYFFITLRNSATLSLINKNEDKHVTTVYNYDVFVSYCNEDRAWVLDQLLPHVERDSNITVCLHERDFQVGLSILENIVSCMDRSRSIMLILSQRFLLSQWCQFEMHLAQHRLLETRREDLILVLLEEVPRRLRPNTLHYLMLTKTYIVWPKTEDERSQFWKRLKKSLVTYKLKRTENDSLA